MSLKQEIETWVEALAHYDNNEFEEALKTFDNIADTSRILFNCGVIHATLGQHAKAVESYQRAIRLDQYLAVAYFQQGVSNFLVGDFEEALANFNDTLLYLRGNTYIDYDQLGLKFKLYSCEVLFNRGLCYVYLQQKEDGMQDLSYAVKEKAVEEHNVIDEAIQEEAEGYTVFSIPVGVVYRPNSAKVKNLKTKDYLGKARLVAATTRNNTFTGFVGAELKKSTPQPGTVKDDRPPDVISFAASNLVKPGLRSRTRQQSEPPLNRQVFPPTPPPESDRASLFRRSNELDQAFPSNRNTPTNSTELERTSSNRIAPVSTESERPTLSRMNTSMTINESERGPSSSRSNISASRDSEWTSPSSMSSRTTLTAGSEVSKPALSRAHTDASPGGASSLMMNERALSVRGGKGRPEIQVQTQVQAPEEVRERPRLGTMRTASEPRGPSRSYSSSRVGQEYIRPPRMMSRERLRGPDEEPTVLEDERSPEGGIYEMYRSHNRNKSFSGRRAASRGPPRGQPEFIEEEEEEEDPNAAVGGGSSRGSSSIGGAEEGADEDDVSVDSRDFEVISHTRRPSTTASATTAGGRSRNAIRKVRIKVHVQADTRYILFTNHNDTTALSVRYSDVVDRITDKFGLHNRRFRCTVLDDGDQITLGDQDDLDMALSTAKSAARREGADMAKMEVWVVDSSR